MDKNFIISQIESLIESHQLWEEMSNHIFALGGELWETKYAEAYHYHEALVYDLIIQHRNRLPFSEADFELFQEAIYDLSRKDKVIIYLENSDKEILTLSSAEELYNYMMISY